MKEEIHPPENRTDGANGTYLLGFDLGEGPDVAVMHTVRTGADCKSALPVRKEAKAKPVKREMTAEERLVIPWLWSQVNYSVGSWDKRFAREIQYALTDGLITEGQSGQVWRLFWRYRRQIVCADKERLLEMAEKLKPRIDD
jgi:hypothetical protein